MIAIQINLEFIYKYSPPKYTYDRAFVLKLLFKQIMLKNDPRRRSNCS